MKNKLLNDLTTNFNLGAVLVAVTQILLALISPVVYLLFMFLLLFILEAANRSAIFPKQFGACTRITWTVVSGLQKTPGMLASSDIRFLIKSVFRPWAKTPELHQWCFCEKSGRKKLAQDAMSVVSFCPISSRIFKSRSLTLRLSWRLSRRPSESYIRTEKFIIRGCECAHLLLLKVALGRSSPLFPRRIRRKISYKASQKPARGFPKP